MTSVRARTRRCNWAAVAVAATRLVTSGMVRPLRRRRLRLRRPVAALGILMTSAASRRLLLLLPPLLATMVASVISGTARLRLLVAVRRLERQTLGISVRVRILRLSSVLLAKVLRVMRRLVTLAMVLRPLLLLRLLLETMGSAISATVHRVIRHRRKRNRHLVLRTLETLGPARTLLFSSALREGLRIPGLLSVTLETDLPRLRRPLLPPETMGSVTLAATSPPLLQQLPSHRPPVPLTLAILV